MAGHSSVIIKECLKFLLIALVIYYVLFIWKIPIPCSGCEEPNGLWYRCMTGTGLGTETCRIATSDSSFSFNFSLPKLDLNVDLSGLNAILADSALVRLPKEWIQALTSMWVSVKTFAQSIITHISDLFSYVGRQITKIVNEYVIGYAKAAVETVNTYIIMPVIRGITNYIIEPIKSVLRQVVGFKDSSISVLKTILKEVAGIGSTVYDYTIGALIAGFDQIPNGIILFVEGIQWLLNNLKHGIIGGANIGLNFMTQDVLNPLTSALFEAAKGAVSATQWTVDGVLGATDSFVNFFVDNLLNPVGGVVNDVLSYDLGTGVRSGVNTLIDGVNYIYDRAVVPIVNPIIGVVQTVADGTVGAINAVEELDITGWIPEIDLGFTTIDIPSVRPFSWIPHLESPRLGTLNPSPIGHLTTDDIPVFHIADSIGTLSPIGHLNLVGMVGDFATPANTKLTGWQADAVIGKDLITEPDNLFWAGTLYVTHPSNPLPEQFQDPLYKPNVPYPTGDVCTLISNAYPITVNEDGSNGRSYATDPFSSISDQYNTATCRFSTLVTNVPNGYIGSSSCTDVCFQNGNFGQDGNDSQGACNQQFFLYGTPDSNAMPKYVSPKGLTFWLYNNKPVIHFAPNVYLVDVSVNLDLESIDPATGLKSYPISENSIAILDDDPANTTTSIPFKKFFRRIQNGGYVDTRNPTHFYITASSLDAPGPVNAWRYFTNPATGCNNEYFLTGSPEAAGLVSSVNSKGIQVYSIDGRSYVYRNPKLYRLNDAELEISLDQLTSPTSPYVIINGYSDQTPDQTVLLYTQNGYRLSDNQKVVLPRKFVNNVSIALTPDQAGFQSATHLNTFTYYTNNNVNYAYDQANGTMIAINFTDTVTITGTPGSNGYSAGPNGYGYLSPSGDWRAFAVMDQKQYYLLLKQEGFPMDTANAVALGYTRTGNVGQVVYKTPEEDGYARHTAGSLTYYTKSGRSFVHDEKAEVMVPLLSLTPTRTVYGTPISNGNSYREEVFGYSQDGTTYYFAISRRSMFEYLMKSLYNPVCNCTRTQVVTKTCTDFCASTVDSSNSKMGCDDNVNRYLSGFVCDDVRQNDMTKCACTEQGPVNVIAKPMRKYNPFRLLVSGVEAATSQVLGGIKYAIQSFLTPVWNAIRGIFQFMGSVVHVAAQFFSNLFSSSGSSNSSILGVIRGILSGVADGFHQYVITDGIMYVVNQVKSIIPTGAQLQALLKPVVDFLGGIMSGVISAFSSTVTAVKNGVVTLAKLVIPPILYYGFYAITKIADYVLFFLPVTPTIKTLILLFGIILGLLYYVAGVEIYTTFLKIGQFFAKFVDWFMVIVTTIVEVIF